MAVDPVCKMQVNEKTAKLKRDYKGTTYYFCAPGCKVVFEKNPEKRHQDLERIRIKYMKLRTASH